MDLNNVGKVLASQFTGLNGQQPWQWPIVPRIVCAIFVAAAVTGAGWYFYWEPLTQEIELSVQKEEKLRGVYKEKVRQAVNLDALRKQKEQVNQYVAELEKQLPGKAEMDALLSDINQAGLGRGLQFQLFKPGQVVVREYYAELPISIKISGAYHDIGAFTGDIANMSRIVTLNGLNLTGGKGSTLTLDATAKTFRYLDADEQKSAKKGGNK